MTGLAEQTIERRARMLADAVEARVDLYRRLINPAGRPMFTTQMSKQKALDWWAINRTTPAGQQVLQRMTPVQIMELDAALAQRRLADEPGEIG